MRPTPPWRPVKPLAPAPRQTENPAKKKIRNVNFLAGLLLYEVAEEKNFMIGRSDNRESASCPVLLQVGAKVFFVASTVTGYQNINPTLLALG